LAAEVVLAVTAAAEVVLADYYIMLLQVVAVRLLTEKLLLMQTLRTQFQLDVVLSVAPAAQEAALVIIVLLLVLQR
jgi:hypothetical protein